MQSRLFASLRSFLRAQSTGHATLAALFSVSGGILFSMAMIDFAKVVIASNAVETATAAVTRCLSTTDGECKTQSLSEPKLNLAWYGYNPEQQVVEYADRYNYRASMRRENWQASFPTYYLNRLSPEVQWQEYEVPVHTVSAEMNRFEQRYATRRMIGNQPLESFRAAFSRFGTFDGSREEVLRYGAGWSYSGNPANGDGTALHSVSDSIRIAANTTHTFRSGWSAVPALTATASSTRQRMNGSAWAGKIVNHGGNQDDWWRDAYLAIKLTGSFLRVPGQGNADLRWENIVVESCEQINPRSNCEASRSLGGVTGIEISHSLSPQWSNPYFRGPAGSHGGGTPGEHQGIHVKRGNFVRISADLVVDRNPLDAQLSVQSWYDGYQTITTPGTEVSSLCPGSVLLTTNNSHTLCPTDPAVCGLPAGLVNLHCDVENISLLPLCDDPGNNTGFAASPSISAADQHFVSQFTAQVASCSSLQGQQLQQTTSSLGRRFCSLQGSSVGSVIVGAQPSGCSGLAGQSRQQACSPAYAGELSGPAAQCSWLPNYLSANQSQVAAQNQEQFGLGPSLSALSLSSFSWSSLNSVWQFSWTLPASLAAGGLPSCVLPVAQRQSASACVDEFYQRNPLQLSRYEHTPSQPPGILEFNPPRGANGSLPPAGLPVSLTSTVESVAVNQVPPFNQQPSFEITKISPGNGCEVNHASPEEVEAELRLYASQQIPEAANPSYSFESSYEYFDTSLDYAKSLKPFLKILLSHNPDIVIHPTQKRHLESIHLILSGHTHGGQIRLPLLGPIVTHTQQRQHVRGLSRADGRPIYVSSGIGYGLIQLRLFCPPEIVVFNLKRAAQRLAQSDQAQSEHTVSNSSACRSPGDV